MRLRITMMSFIITLSTIGTMTANAKPLSPVSASQKPVQQITTEHANGTGTTSKGQKPHHHRGHHRRSLVRQVANILQMEPSSLYSELKQGKSLMDVAASKGITEQTLVSKLRTDLQIRLHKAQQDGQISPAKAQKILAHFDAHVHEKLQYRGSHDHPLFHQKTS